jgi:predicted RNase H-like HicB family nuclease
LLEEVRSNAEEALGQHLEGEEPPAAHTLRELLEEGLDIGERDLTAAVKHEPHYATA